MSSPFKIAQRAAAFAGVILMAACSNKSTAPVTPDPVANDILVSSLSASVVPGGVATLKLSTTDGSTCTAVCDNSAVALVNVSGPDLEIEGTDYGKTTVRVTSSSGLTRQIPVEVYNPRLLETDELYITFVDSFDVAFRSMTAALPWPMMPHYASFFNPRTQDGFRYLGSLGLRDGYPPQANANGKHVAMLVKAKPGSDALASAEGLQRVWDHNGSVITNPGYFHTLQPPPGYVAMGTWVTPNWIGIDVRSDRAPVCVREDLTYIGEAGAFIWNDDDSRAPRDVGVWEIETRSVPPDEKTYMPVGTFVAWNYWHRPTAHPVMNVLRVALPRLNDGPGQDFVPKLEGFATPPTETPPLRAYEMLVPWTMIDDAAFTPEERFAQSPMYRLERQVFYRRLFHNHNTTSVTQNNSVEIMSGVSTTDSERFWQSTGISITAEAGVSIGPFSAKVSTTVSKEMGYESQTSVTELKETTVHVDAVTLPGKATTVWQKWTRFVVKRHSGTELQPVAAWDFGIDSYVIDEYPD